MNPEPVVSDLALRAFAAGFEALRRDHGMTGWDANGVKVWLTRLIREDDVDPFRAVAFMAKAAADPQHDTPGSVRLSSSREPFTPGCRDHPESGTRLDGRCAGCWAERFEPVDYRRPVPDVDVAERARQARAEIERARQAATSGRQA